MFALILTKTMPRYIVEVSCAAILWLPHSVFFARSCFFRAGCRHAYAPARGRSSLLLCSFARHAAKIFRVLVRYRHVRRATPYWCSASAV